MLKHYNLLIGEQTAEMIKIKIGSACLLPKEGSVKLKAAHGDRSAQVIHFREVTKPFVKWSMPLWKG